MRRKVTDARSRAFLDRGRLLAEIESRLLTVADLADPHPNPGSLEWSDEVGRALAEEVVRLMEWIRARDLEHVADARHDAPRWAYETGTQIREAVLSLPPDDWQAPEVGA